MKEIMICSNCGKECLMASIKPRGRESVVVSHCCRSSFNSKDNWIDLDIDNLPSQFFTRDDIEIEYKMVSGWGTENDSRVKIITQLVAKEYKYRYRIQEKKPMIINEDLKEFIMSKISDSNGDLKSWNGVPIIIID